MDIPLLLPYSGIVLNNRIVKSALSECLSIVSTHCVSDSLINLYKVWDKSCASILKTGNIQVNSNHMESPSNICISKSTIKKNDFFYKQLIKWSNSCSNCILIAQISHAGRQTPLSVNWKPICPSSTSIKLKGLFGSGIYDQLCNRLLLSVASDGTKSHTSKELCLLRAFRIPAWECQSKLAAETKFD